MLIVQRHTLVESGRWLESSSQGCGEHDEESSLAEHGDCKLLGDDMTSKWKYDSAGGNDAAFSFQSET